ncbi:hypothetical protein HJFPF1_06371 [Paramyrothecium foliicola]|nr:hypothetical protein HJFPF1_06371 [Paramyrothecium foliicola]
MLPRVHIAGQDRGLHLIAQGSIDLVLPFELQHLTTCEELLTSVRGQHLWIARAGACQFIATLAWSEANTSPHISAYLSDWVGSWETWMRLGLRLLELPCFDCDPTLQAFFSIHHPDLSSTLTPPDGALTAIFRSVTYSFEVHFDEHLPQTVPKQKRKRQQDYIVSGQRAEAGDRHTIKSSRDIFSELAVEDQLAINDFVRRLEPSPAGAQSAYRRKRALANTGGPSRVTPTSEDVKHLVHAALNILVLGSRVNKGVKVIEGSESPNLAQVAPAVFHIPYLKTVTDRAKLMPVIATSLARMSNAESPRLRQKIAALSTVPIAIDHSLDPNAVHDSAICNIEQRVWKTVLATTRLPALPARKSAENGDQQTGSFSSRSIEHDMILSTTSQGGSSTGHFQEVTVDQAMTFLSEHDMRFMSDSYMAPISHTYLSSFESFATAHNGLMAEALDGECHTTACHPALEESEHHGSFQNGVPFADMPRTMEHNLFGKSHV